MPRFICAYPEAYAGIEATLPQLSPPVAQAIRWAMMHGTIEMTPEPPPLYLRLLEQFDHELPYDGTAGLCATVAARHRMRTAIYDGDLTQVGLWLAEGSDRAVRQLFEVARPLMPHRRYAEFLEVLLRHELTPVRRAAVIMELGRLNRAINPEGGDAEVNRILIDEAMTEEAYCLGTARLAARELSTIGNIDTMMYLLDDAPLLPVAEEVLMALKRMRRLQVADAIIARRKELMPVYRNAHRELVEIQNLVQAIWSTQDDDLIALMMGRLHDLDAQPELEKLAYLRHHHGVPGEGYMQHESGTRRRAV